MMHEKTMACLHLYDTCYDKAQKVTSIPFQSMIEYMDQIERHVKKHGPFTMFTYEKYMEDMLGKIDWDRLE